MQVSISCMEDISDRQRILLTHLVDLAERLRDSCARNHSILDVVRGRDAPNGAECRFAPLPQELTLIFVAGTPNFTRTASAAKFRNDLCLFINRLTQSFKLDEQHRRR